MKAIRHNSSLAAAIILSNVSVLALIFLVPGLLTPEAYVKFSLAWSIAQFTVSLCYEPLRVNLIRYTEIRDKEHENKIIGTTKILYKLVNYILLIVGLTALLFYAYEFAIYLFIVCLYALLQGNFDARQATFRARFQLLSFSRNWVIRSVLSFVLALGAAYTWGDARYVLFAISLSFLGGAIFFVDSLKNPGMNGGNDSVKQVLLYGWPVALSSLAAASLTILAKYAATGEPSYEEAAGVILALDLSVKVLMAVAMAANILILQNSIRSIEKDSPTLFKKKNQANLSLMCAAIIPTGFGFLASQEFVIYQFVPDEYLRSYLLSSAVLITAATVISLRVFVIDTQFVVLGKSKYALYGSLSSVALFYLTYKILEEALPIAELRVPIALLFSAAASSVVSFYLASSYRLIAWPTVELVKIIAASCAMYCLKFILPYGSTLIGYLGYVALSIVLYVTVLMALNFNNYTSRLIDIKNR